MRNSLGPCPTHRLQTPCAKLSIAIQTGGRPVAEDLHHSAMRLGSRRKASPSTQAGASTHPTWSWPPGTAWAPTPRSSISRQWGTLAPTSSWKFLPAPAPSPSITCTRNSSTSSADAAPRQSGWMSPGRTPSSGSRAASSAYPSTPTTSTSTAQETNQPASFPLPTCRSC